MDRLRGKGLPVCLRVTPVDWYPASRQPVLDPCRICKIKRAHSCAM
jgi:hypothetical protein